MPVTDRKIPLDVAAEVQIEAGDEAAEISLRDILDVLFRRRRLVLGVALLTIGVGVYLMLRPRTYTADGTIRIQPDAESMYRTSPLAALSPNTASQIDTEMAIMQSRTLYFEVARQLGLVNNAAFWGVKRIKPASLDNAVTREKLIGRMKMVVGVKHSPNDNLIHISCTTISPALSAKIVNALINGYIEYLFRMRYGSTKRTSDWLMAQLDDLKHQIEHDQAQIIDLQQRLGIVGFSEQNAMYLQTQLLGSITKAANEATVARILAEAKLRNLKDSNPNLIEGEVNVLTQGQASTAQNGLLQNLRSEQAQVANNYARILVEYGPNYPDVRQEAAQLNAINKEVKTEEQRILNQATVSYDAAKANENMENNLLQRKTEEAFASGGAMAKYVLLLHDYESRRSLYEELVQRLREATITSGLEAGEIDIVDLADLPVIPNPPGPLTVLAGSLLFGLIAGCVIALGFSAIDSRMTTVEQVQRATNLPPLALVPRMILAKNGRDNTPLSAVPGLALAGSAYSEALQSLRSAILLSRPGSPPRVILVTSSVPAEGKSMTSRNLANAFAQHGARVLLIDADLRRGSLAHVLRLSNEKGLSSYLAQKISLEDVIQSLPGADNLAILPAGPTPPNPTVLTGSSEMEKLIQECRQRFDFVILDSPPMLGLSDTVNLGQFVDAAVFIAREEMSTRKVVQEAVRRMVSARIPVVGFVFNNVDLRAHAYSYGYDYRTYANYYHEK